MNSKAYTANTKTVARVLVALVTPALALGVLGLTACGGEGGSGGQPETGAPSTIEAEQQVQAEAERQLQARRNELEEATNRIAQIHGEAETGIPVKDERLEQLLTDLDEAASQAEAKIDSGAGDAALQQVEILQQQASERLVELRAVEQEIRRELHEQYQQAVEQAEPVQPDLVRGLNGELYLGYLPTAIERAQRELRRTGFYDGPVSAVLDEDTQVAIARFQQVNELEMSGIPSPYTRAALYSDD